MVCQNCVDGETCPDCEKHPHDIHTTPPDQYFGIVTPWGKIDLRTPEMRIAQLEKEVWELRNQIAMILKHEAV